MKLTLKKIVSNKQYQTPLNKKSSFWGLNSYYIVRIFNYILKPISLCLIYFIGWLDVVCIMNDEMKILQKILKTLETPKPYLCGTSCYNLSGLNS